MYVSFIVLIHQRYTLVFMNGHNLLTDKLVRVFNMGKSQKILTRGVEVESLNTTTVPRKMQTSNLAYESFTFCPLTEVSARSVEYHFHELVDLVLENHSRSRPLNIVDIITNHENSLAVL